MDLLQRMPILKWKQERIDMDFLVGLSTTLGQHDSTWVIVERLTKLDHFIPSRVYYNSKKLAKIYIKEILRVHGILISIIFYRGTQLTSKFQGILHEELGTNLAFSTIFHPQTDGQSERPIHVLGDILRAYVTDFIGNWDKILLLCEFHTTIVIILALTQLCLVHSMVEGVGCPQDSFFRYDVKPFGTNFFEER